MVENIFSYLEILRLIELDEHEITARLAQALLSSQSGPDTEFIGLPEFLDGDPRPAAVLIPLLRQGTSWHMLLTRRNADLPEHSGQVAFPGGRADPEDRTPEETALRETQEEIGIAPQDVHILGKLPSYHTITNYMVTPIIGLIPWPYPLRPAPHEVTRVFTVPLDWLADEANHEIRFHPLPGPRNPVPVVYFSAYDGEVLWGASARFTLALLRSLRLID